MIWRFAERFTVASEELLVRQRGQMLITIYLAFGALISLYLPYVMWMPLYDGKRAVITVVIVGILGMLGFNIWLCRRARIDLSLLTFSVSVLVASLLNTWIVGQIRTSMWTFVAVGMLGCFAQRTRVVVVNAVMALLSIVLIGLMVRGTMPPARLNDELVRAAFVVSAAAFASRFIARIHRQIIDRLIETRDRIQETAHQAQLLRERAEQEQRQAELASEAKGRFLANISHELRTPLNAILGYAEILHEEFIELDEIPPELTEDAERIQLAARHLLEMIQDVLDLSDIESGKLQIKPRRFDVRDMCREILTSMQLAISQYDNVIRDEDLLTDPMLYTDPVWVRQILFNLISNAAKFTSGGEIVVRMEEVAPGEIVLEVRDTGLGMSQEVQRRIFEEFEQADVLVGREFGGSGLGLPLCRTLAAHMGGELGLSSAPGEGTRAWLRLPREVVDVAV